MSRPRLLDLICEQCKQPMQGERPTKRFCSPECYRAMRNGWPKTRACKQCGTEFLVLHRADANRRYCNQICSKTAARKLVRDWQKTHTDEMKGFAADWRERNPGYYRGTKADEKRKTLKLLGGEGVVCGVTNPFWLHIDYIPTCRGLRYRHPRGFAYVSAHQADFRLLCANHHYELTITGKIEGTEITQ